MNVDCLVVLHKIGKRPPKLLGVPKRTFAQQPSSNKGLVSIKPDRFFKKYKLGKAGARSLELSGWKERAGTSSGSFQLTHPRGTYSVLPASHSLEPSEAEGFLGKQIRSD